MTAAKLLSVVDKEDRFLALAREEWALTKTKAGLCVCRANALGCAKVYIANDAQHRRGTTLFRKCVL